MDRNSNLRRPYEVQRLMDDYMVSQTDAVGALAMCGGYEGAAKFIRAERENRRKLAKEAK